MIDDGDRAPLWQTALVVVAGSLIGWAVAAGAVWAVVRWWSR